MNRAAAKPAAVALTIASVLGLVCTPVLAGPQEIERTIAFIELRQGADPNSLTDDYLKEVQRTFQAENKGDFIFVPTSQILSKLGKTRDQLPRKLTPERRTMLSEARKKGIEYLDRADAANAIEALGAAASKYRSALAAPGADDKLRAAYLDILANLATAHILAKQDDKAADVFRLVVTTFGLKANITDDMYRPDVVEVFKKVVAEVKRLDKGKIEATSTPSGAKIIVNGAGRGETPGTVDDLIPGIYSVHMEKDNVTSMLHRVRVQGGKTTRVTFDLALESHLVLEDGAAGLSYKDLDETQGRVSVDGLAIGKTLGVNLVVAIGVIERKLVTYVIDTAKGEVVGSGKTNVPQVGLSKRAVTNVMETIKGKAGTGPTEPWYTYKPGLYVAGGGLVALTIGLIYMPALLSGKTFYQCPDETQLCANPSPLFKQKAEDAAASYNGDRVLAITGLALGVVLGGVSAWMFYKHSQSGGLASLTELPAPDQMHAMMPPSSFGEQRVVFPLRF